MYIYISILSRKVFSLAFQAQYTIISQMKMERKLDLESIHEVFYLNVLFNTCFSYISLNAFEVGN